MCFAQKTFNSEIQAGGTKAQKTMYAAAPMTAPPREGALGEPAAQEF